MSIEDELLSGAYTNSVYRLSDGRRWIGDESSGFPEDQLSKKPDDRNPVGPSLEERSYFKLFGGGKPNLE